MVKAGWLGISLWFIVMLVYNSPGRRRHVVSPVSLGTGHNCCFCSFTQYFQRSSVMWDVSVS